MVRQISTAMLYDVVLAFLLGRMTLGADANKIACDVIHNFMLQYYNI